MCILYVVGMPAVNLADVTLRALRMLRAVDLVVVQNVDRAQEFLAFHGIETPLAHYARYKGTVEGEPVLEALTCGDVALLCEEGRAASGGFGRLVCAALERGFVVSAVPGPSAAVMALVISGLPADAYMSLGFLPRRAVERRQLLACLAAERRTLVAFQTADCLLVTLRDVAEMLGDRPLALLPLGVTPDEGIWRGTVSEAAVHFEVDLFPGEWALVIGGATEEAGRWPEDRVRSELARLLAEGLGRKVAAQQVARASGWRSREVYRLATEGRFRV
jgi:16S rRNA (cytidine1402-2'-O)-methyltransferase